MKWEHEIIEGEEVWFCVVVERLPTERGDIELTVGKRDGGWCAYFTMDDATIIFLAGLSSCTEAKEEIEAATRLLITRLEIALR